MLSILLAKFWPTIIPSIVYFLWLKYIKKKYNSLESKSTKNQLIATIWTTIIITIICLGLYFYFEDRSDKTYVPSRIENGKFIPGRKE